MSRKCFSCEGELEIVECDDCSITVICDSCGEEFRIEPDGLDEGGMEWVEAMEMKENGLL